MPYSVNSLNDVLGQSDLREAFEKFADKDHASENLEFLKAVNDYKAAVKNPRVSDDELRQKARDIQAKFISSTADDTPVPVKQTTAKGQMLDLTSIAGEFDPAGLKDLLSKASTINLTSPCYQNVSDGMAQINTMSRGQMGQVFDAAHSEIEFLAINDTLGRFKGTQEFQEAQKKANAELAPIEKLEARLDKLKNPSWTDRVKAVFKGGMDNARQEIADKIDREKLNLLRKNSPDAYEAEMQQRSERRDAAKQYFTAQHKAQSAEMMQDMLGGTMTKNESAKLEQEKQEALQTMKKLESEVSARKGLNQVSSNSEKHVSVRSELQHEAEEHSHHHGLKNQQAPKQGQGTHPHL